MGQCKRSFQEAQDRITAQGISLQARLRYQQTSQSPWTVVENITCGELPFFVPAWRVIQVGNQCCGRSQMQTSSSSGCIIPESEIDNSV